MTEDRGQIPEGGRNTHEVSALVKSLNVGLLPCSVHSLSHKRGADSLLNSVFGFYIPHTAVCVMVGLSVPRMETFAQPHG